MAAGLGPLYLVVLAIIAAYTLLMLLLAKWELWLPAQVAIYMFCILSTFSVLGGALYERRHQLGLETWVSPERTADIQSKQTLRQAERDVTEAYGKMRAGSHIESWQLLQTWLASRAFAPEDYRWLCEHVASWNDPRYITRLTQDYVDRLLTLKQTGQALDAVTQRLAHDPHFRPKTAAATLQIAQIAVHGGSRRVARALLADFSTRFPGDPTLAAANALTSQLQS